MVKPEWGTKRTCPKCSTRFYDLGKDNPVHCIACEHDFVPEPVLKSKQPMPFEAPTAAASPRKRPPTPISAPRIWFPTRMKSRAPTMKSISAPATTISASKPRGTTTINKR